jgi:dTDP-4-amino-4,6-dideoxygalactose transaminase
MSSLALPLSSSPKRARLPGWTAHAGAPRRSQGPGSWAPRIHFNHAAIEGRELEFMAAAVRSGQVAGDGPFTRKCHAWLESTLGVQKALLTTSCTDALEMAAVLLDLQPGDEVIVPSFTFVSTANAFVLHGARPVFCDIRPDTLNLDEAKLPALIGPRTKAVVVVHYAGIGCEMRAIREAAARTQATVIEDNAHGLLGRYRGEPLGRCGGALATLSFHETKNFTCGEGGALLINEPRHLSRAEIIREKGTNRARFFRGEVDKYTWVDAGSSHLPSDVLAAYLYAQFLAAPQIQASRRRIWLHYFERLGDWARRHGVRLPFVPDHCEPAWHLFHLVLPTPAARQALLAHLKARGILGVFHYVPLHLSPMGKRFGAAPDGCPVAEYVSERIVRLPFHNRLTAAEQDQVIEAVREFVP